MSETIVLDPSPVASGRTEIDITHYVDTDGPDWGDAAISAYMADQRVGSSTVDYRIPNRTIKIPLNLRDVGATAFSTIRSQLQQKIALWQREGGLIMRKAGGVSLYANVVDATLHLGGSWMQAYRSADVDAVLTLECVPDWWGDEVTLDLISATGVCASVLKQDGSQAVVEGDHPARCRIVLTETSANTQLEAFWAFRSRYYDSASTAGLIIQAESLGLRGSASVTTNSSAYGGHVVTLPLSTSSSSSVGFGPTYQTHQGSYRVLARASATASGSTLQLGWGIDLVHPTANAKATVPTTGFHIVDLGIVNIARSPVSGVNAWDANIFSYGPSGQSIALDCLWLQPLDEGAGDIQAVNYEGVTFDAVAYASQITEIRTEGVWREGAGHTAYGPPGFIGGDLPRLPPSGLENRPVELLVKPSRGRMGNDADAGIDTFTVQVFYRPSYLYVG